MINKLIFCVLCLGWTTVFATNGDDASVRKLLDNFITQWNKHDVKEMANFWTEDGDLINPWGRWGTNKAGVLKIFTEDLGEKGKLSKSTMKYKVDKIRFVGPDMAFVDTTNTISGVENSDNKTETSMEHHVVWLLAKKNSDWHVVSARPYKLLGTLTEVH